MKPTDKQINCLTNLFYEAIYEIDIKVADNLPREVVSAAVGQIPTLKEASEEISAELKTPRIVHPAARKYLEEYFTKNNIKINF